MSRLSVETFQRGEYGYIAVAHYDGQIIANGGVGSGDSERAAIQEAVNCLYTREDERDRAAAVPLIGPPTEHPADGYAGWTPDAPVKNNALGWATDDPREDAVVASAPRPAVRITGLANIVRALEHAMLLDPKPKFWLEYSDAQGEYTEREIVALGLDERAGRLGFRTGGQMLVALDTAKDEPRHFRVDRITAITEQT